ncbi:MAG: GyrI-like domain-containing protein, partial [Candidatus Methanoplasma sp.]|nr:GyrI-like domain-containing protein [Candidatus Methanoplasma sp.]
VTSPSLITVPRVLFITVEGEGPPGGELFTGSIELLYSISYTIKMKGKDLNGWFDHIVPPLEGSWWSESGKMPEDRNEWKWKLMIRQPEYVDKNVFEWASEIVKRKKPKLDVSKAVLEFIDEGACVQAMHIGPYSTEEQTMEKIREFADANALRLDTDGPGRHHEIYISDPEKTAPEKMRTVIRFPVSDISL